MEEVKSKILAIISEKLGKEAQDIDLKASLVNDLGLDSLDTVEIIMEFEKSFNISIPDEEAEKIANVGDAIAYISGKLSAKKL